MHGIGKNKKSFLLFLFGALVLISIIGVLIFKYINFYKISDRVDEKEKFSKKYDDYQTVGWLRVQGTNIDYPIIYNAGNIDVDHIGDLNFLWTNSNEKKLTNRMLVVGHNIRNVSANPIIGDENHARFEQLMAYIYYDFVKDNKYIQYTIDGKNYLYKIFSISFVDNNEIDYGTNSYSKKELDKYITESISDSYFKFDIDVNKDDNIITLLTCTRMFGSYANKTFKIDARMVRDNEFITNYNVKENSNYKDIKKIMEGGDSNEKA